jgi:hypothetical protein
MKKIISTLFASGLLSVALAAPALQFSRDTVNVANWISDEIQLLNSSGTAVTIDSVGIKVLAGMKGQELGFAFGPTDHEMMGVMTLDSSSKDSLSSQGWTHGTTANPQVPAHGSLRFSRFMFGNCLLCVEAAAGSAGKTDYVIRVTFHSKKRKLAAAFIMQGRWLSGSVRAASGIRRFGAAEPGSIKVNGQSGGAQSMQIVFEGISRR